MRRNLRLFNGRQLASPVQARQFSWTTSRWAKDTSESSEGADTDSLSKSEAAFDPDDTDPKSSSKKIEKSRPDDMTYSAANEDASKTMEQEGKQPTTSQNNVHGPQGQGAKASGGGRPRPGEKS